MQFQSLHPNFILPTKGSPNAAAFDIYMPETGYADGSSKLIPLGFAAAVPENHVGLLLPRSGTGARHGLELNNTCGVIDADYRGEWMAALRTKSGLVFAWEQGERILQCLIVPVLSVQPVLVEYLGSTNRGSGGFGSSGK